MEASSSFSGLIANLYLMFPVVLFSLFIGGLAGVYMEEWLPKTNWVRRAVEGTVAILAGIPSILYGFLGVEVFIFREGGVRFSTSALTFVLIVMPVAIQSTQQGIQRIDTPLREAAYVLGSNKWQVLRNHILPLACPSILAGMCRAVSRALAVAGMLIGIQTIIPIVATSVFNTPRIEIGFSLGGALFFSCTANMLERHSQKRFA